MLSLLIEFAFKLLTGEVWSVYQKYKAYENVEAQNRIASLSDADVANELRSKFTHE